MHYTVAYILPLKPEQLPWAKTCHHLKTVSIYKWVGDLFAAEHSFVGREQDLNMLGL